METTRRARAVIVAVLLIVVACTRDGRVAGPTHRPATPSPSRSTAKAALCQPFPDRLIDDFLAAYNGRKLGGLERLVTAPEIEDVVAAAYEGESTFSGVEDWATSMWAAGDRIRSSGYGAFHRSRTGFQMLVTRRSDGLAQEGIEQVSVALDADTDGCTITSLRSAGPVHSLGEPCAFYETFRSVPDVAEAEPRACADGSAAHARSAPAAVAVDGRALVWGGARGGHFTFGDVAMDGLLLDFRRGSATRVPPLDAPAFRPEAHAWTGSELIVVGSKVRPDYGVAAAAYSPATRSWRRIPFPFDRTGGFEGVWTGRELLLWGGPDHSEDPLLRGLAYDPLTGRWRRTAPAPGGGRWSHSLVWTGTEMIVFGGGDADTHVAGGLAYDPAADTWRRIAPSPLAPREWMPLAWTGREVLVWGGSSFGKVVRDGAAYDPATDSWRKLAGSPLRGRYDHSMTWTGSEAVVFGGYDYHRAFSDAAAYDPATDGWRRMPQAPGKPRFDHAAVWTGTALLAFGGTWDFGHMSLGDGAAYDPVTNRWHRVVPRFGW